MNFKIVRLLNVYRTAISIALLSPFQGGADLCNPSGLNPFQLFDFNQTPQMPLIPLVSEQQATEQTCSYELTPSPAPLLDPNFCFYKPPPVVFDFISAINRALDANRQLASSYDIVAKSDLNLELLEGEFAWKIRPNGQIGYIGGGRAGTGVSYGAGIDFFKRFPLGTRFNFRPYVERAAHKYFSNIKMTIAQPLLRGFGREYTMAGVLGAQFASRSSYRNLYQARIKLILRTLGAVYEVIRQQEMHRLNLESYERLKGFRDAAKLKERIGLADSLDVYRAEIELRHAEDGLQSSEEHLENSLDTLKDILALPMDLDIAVVSPLEYKESCVSIEDAINTALENRIEIDQAIDQLKDNQRLTRLARQNLLPELNLVLDYNNCGSDPYFIRSCRRKRENTWGIGFTTSNEYNLAAQETLLGQTQLSEGEAERNLDQTYTTIILETKHTYRALQRAAKRIKLQEEQIKTAEGELYLSQIKFNRGLANNFDVIQAERNLRMARSALIGAVIDHILGEYQFLAAMGMLADKPTFNTCY